MKEKEQNKKLKGLSSMRLTIVIMTICAVVITSFGLMVPAITTSGTALKSMARDSITDLAISYGSVVDELCQVKEEPSYEDFQSKLADVKVGDAESSYAYVVDANGIMLYHPTKDKVGNTVENSVVKGLVSELQAGKTPSPDFVSYDFKGVQKYAGYYITSNKSIVVVTADEDDFLKPVQNMKNKVFSIACIIAVIVSAIVWGISHFMMKKLTTVTELVSRIGSFDFRKDDKIEKLLVRKDEVGKIARATEELSENLTGMVIQIEGVSQNISENAVQLRTSSTRVNEDSMDNSATAQELAAGMEETSATTQTIAIAIESINRETVDINGMSKKGGNLAKQVQAKADSLRDDVEKMRSETQNLYETVKAKSKIAMEKSKSVEKINTLATAIMDISSQTGLLSLNASIEAARAGENGKGFAVVAGEIGNLAKQSSDAVSEITGIVNEVVESVENMTDCLKQMNEFLEVKVTKDYDSFTEVTNQYHTDAEFFEESMEGITGALANLTNKISEITSSIEGINSTVEESATGVTNIAEKTSDIVGLNTQTYDMVEKNVDYSNTLQNIVGRFTI